MRIIGEAQSCQINLAEFTVWCQQKHPQSATAKKHVADTLEEYGAPSVVLHNAREIEKHKRESTIAAIEVSICADVCREMQSVLGRRATIINASGFLVEHPAHTSVRSWILNNMISLAIQASPTLQEWQYSSPESLDHLEAEVAASTFLSRMLRVD